MRRLSEGLLVIDQQPATNAFEAITVPLSDQITGKVR